MKPQILEFSSSVLSTWINNLQVLFSAIRVSYIDSSCKNTCDARFTSATVEKSPKEAKTINIDPKISTPKRAR